MSRIARLMPIVTWVLVILGEENLYPSWADAVAAHQGAQT